MYVRIYILSNCIIMQPLYQVLPPLPPFFCSFLFGHGYARFQCGPVNPACLGGRVYAVDTSRPEGKA